VRIVALVHGESDDRVRGGKASLWLRVELRNAHGIAPGKTNPKGTWAGRDEKAKAVLEHIEPAADGTPRVAGLLAIPPDASPSEESENRTIEWLVQCNIDRKGANRARQVTITVAAAVRSSAAASPTRRRRYPRTFPMRRSYTTANTEGSASERGAHRRP